jgi:hypothetical protein
MPTPSIGRDVHYVSRGSADGVYPAVCRAAKITEVGEGGRVGLVVFNPDGEYFFPLTKDGGCAHFDRDRPPDGTICGGDAPGALGTWHWPEPVDQGGGSLDGR